MIPQTWLNVALKFAMVGNNLHALCLFHSGRDLPQWLMRLVIDSGFVFYSLFYLFFSCLFFCIFFVLGCNLTLVFSLVFNKKLFELLFFKKKILLWLCHFSFLVYFMLVFLCRIFFTIFYFFANKFEWSMHYLKKYMITKKKL